jgi:protein EFR3
LGTWTTARDLNQLILYLYACSNVQVTLQILTALMDKAPRDLPLYSNCVLTILETVLKSKDINMIEESLPTFETYCKYQDISSLASDQHTSQQYQNIVHMYAEFSSNEFPSSFKQKLSTPLAMRWKTAGLRAIRSVVGGEAFGTDGTAQLLCQ